MDLQGKRVMIVGMGASGTAAAIFAARRGAHLVMCDRNADLDRSRLPSGELRLGVDEPTSLDGIDLVILSPGVPRNPAMLDDAASRGIDVIGEIELASRFINTPIAAITGTNGKSTVTVMLGAILKAHGMRVFVGGNLGIPLVEAVDSGADAIVAEVSSYQLESIDSFHPHVAIHLNLTDDHFDRYRDIAEYGRAKARIFANQTSADFAILNRDDPNVWNLARSIRARVVGFGFSRGDGDAIWPENRSLAFEIKSTRGKISLEAFQLPGRHNIANAMASSAGAIAIGAAPLDIESALAEIRGLPHRVEFVAEKRGVRWIDDSKGTNVGAAVEAIESTAAPIVLIAGGLDKGGDYAPMRAAIRSRVRLAILNGAARDTMAAALAGATEIRVVETLAEAVEVAAAAARPGDSVLLSPACSSFDQFKDYAHRGKTFQKLVHEV
jgi:UDP-N-acetylmuramoylalanine--D-glutamate ligase